MKFPSPVRLLLFAFLVFSLSSIASAQDQQNPEIPVDRNSGLPESVPYVAPPPPSGDPQEVGEVPLALPADIDPNSSLALSSQFQRWWSSYSVRTNVVGGSQGDLQDNSVVNAVGTMNANVGIPPSGGVPGNRWVGVGAQPLIAGQVGRFLGTRDMSGRVATIAVDPSNVNHWMIGGAQGGVWETIDAGHNWVAKTDNTASLAMGAIAFATNNPRIIYAGTGEAAFSGDGYAGRGLLKTTDGGTNWTLLAKSTFDKTTFARIRVNPTNANMVWAAIAFGTSGRANSFGTPSPARGIMKSTDGGNTWSLKLPATAATDLVLKPGDTTGAKMYAGLGYHSGAPENGIYRSTDQGETFSLITGPWTGDPRGVGRIELAMSPANPNVLYVSIQDAFGGTGVDGGLLGLWKTSNAWDPVPTFSLINTSATEANTSNPAAPGTGSGYCGWDYAFASASNQCWYSHEIAADPSDANILYAGGIPLWRYDGNINVWTEISKTGNANLTLNGFENSIHVDQHAIAFAGNRMIVGNDGGVWSSTDRGETFADHNTNLSLSQYYDGSISQGNETFPGNSNFGPGPGLMLAGAQDNGSHLYLGSNAWGWVGGGDGVDNAISPTNPTTRWAWTSQGNAIVRTFDSGSHSQSATRGLASSRPFVGRFEECLSNENVFIAATNVDLYKNTGFFAPGNFPAWVANPVNSGGLHFTFGSGINAFAFAGKDATCNTYAFNSVGSGNLWLTQDGGVTWKDLRVGNPTMPLRTATDYAFDPTNSNNLYVTFSGFDENTPATAGHIFKSTNALSANPTFTNVTPPVNVPFNTVVVDPVNPSVVYVGTDVGVWRSTNGGGSWIQMGDNNSGMPNVAVFEMQISPVKVAAFTHGRGAFVLGGYDLNGDNAVNCADVSIVTSSMGKRIGQPGYNPAADLNNDNQVNVRDLAMLTKQLPSGTTCP